LQRYNSFFESYKPFHKKDSTFLLSANSYFDALEKIFTRINIIPIFVLALKGPKQ